MDNPDWDSVFQYVSEPLDLGFSSDKPVERPDRVHLDTHQAASQVPTPPVSHPELHHIGLTPHSFPMTALLSSTVPLTGIPWSPSQLLSIPGRTMTPFPPILFSSHPTRSFSTSIRMCCLAPHKMASRACSLPHIPKTMTVSAPS